MRVVVAHPPKHDVRPLRQVLHGAGLECEATDCVAWDDLAVRLAQSDTELVVIQTNGSAEQDWDDLEKATALTKSPILAVGRSSYQETVRHAHRAGAREFLEEEELPGALDDALERLNRIGAVSQSRGAVVSVLAANPGNGGATVATQLAGVMNRQSPGQVSLIELYRDVSKIGLLLNTTSEHSASDVCRRWHTLDPVSLAAGFGEHEDSKLRLLVNGDERADNPSLTTEAVRRLAVLSRIVFDGSVLALESRLGPEQLEAMRLSDSVLIVVQAEVPSVRRARWMLDRAREEGVAPERIHVVVNRWGQPKQLKLKQVRGTLELEPLQLLPEDPSRVNRAVNRGELLAEAAPRAAITRRLSKVAQKVSVVAGSPRPAPAAAR